MYKQNFCHLHIAWRGGAEGEGGFFELMAMASMYIPSPDPSIHTLYMYWPNTLVLLISKAHYCQ